MMATNLNGNYAEPSTAQALEQARSTDSTQLPTITAMVLERALATIWAKILAGPDVYVMSREEFAVFNFFRMRFRTSELARSAIARYWNSPHSSTTAVNGGH